VTGSYDGRPVDLELARQQWADGDRRVAEARSDRRRHDRLLAEMEVVSRELRRRVGQVFTLQELADAYAGADRWARDTIDAADPDGPPALEPGAVTDAAFHQYARGASDYEP
jgi:hypothetical protein